MSKLKQPHHLTINRKQRIVIVGSRQPQRAIVVYESSKPWSLNVMLPNGSEIEIDKKGNAIMKTPMNEGY